MKKPPQRPKKITWNYRNSKCGVLGNNRTPLTADVQIFLSENNYILLLLSGLLCWLKGLLFKEI